MSQHYIHQMALCVANHANVLPNETSIELPGHACLLGNILETAGVALSQPDCSFEMVRNKSKHFICRLPSFLILLLVFNFLYKSLKTISCVRSRKIHS